MKTRSILCALCALCALAIFAGCHEEEVPPSLELSSSAISFPPEGGTETIKVTAVGTEWVAPVTIAWLSVEFDEAASTVTLTASANNSATDRKAAFHIIASKDTQLAKEVSITQGRVIKDMSSEASANCYVADGAGNFSFDATVKGNGVGVSASEETTIAPVSAKLVWESKKGLVKKISLEDGRIVLNLSGEKGNALVAACDALGIILWSWHIWMPEETPAAVATDWGADVMSMNLGAMNSTVGDLGAYGLLYQWGRKDPLPGSPELTGNTSTMPIKLYDASGNLLEVGHSSWNSNDSNTMAFATANPTICIASYAQYENSRDWLKDSEDALWGGSDGLVKTCNDPCPTGWKVPAAQFYEKVTPTGGVSFDYADFAIGDLDCDGIFTDNDFNYGFVFVLGNSEGSYFPAATRYFGQYGMLYGSKAGIEGVYWTSSPYSSDTAGLATAMSFSKEVDPVNYPGTPMMSGKSGAARSDAASVRCVRE